ncbi:MAG: hypothetical protein M0033_01465 [Nitrospiraceae bacterium]|nr:hypothetical protein [Nitrospiraceae bacterium]
MKKQLSEETINAAKEEAIKIYRLCKFGLMPRDENSYSLGEKLFESKHWEFFEVLNCGQPAYIHIQEKSGYEGLFNEVGGMMDIKRLSEGRPLWSDEIAKRFQDRKAGKEVFITEGEEKEGLEEGLIALRPPLFMGFKRQNQRELLATLRSAQKTMTELKFEQGSNLHRIAEEMVKDGLLDRTPDGDYCLPGKTAAKGYVVREIKS